MRHVLALAAVLVVTACAPPAPLDARRGAVARRAVTDGTLGVEGDIGATVSLYMFGDSGCTGTLIAPRVVATAAHCVADLSTGDLDIVVGTLQPSQAPAAAHFAVASMTAHPDYSFFGIPTDDPDGLSDDRDIGVVVLEDAAAGEIAPVLHLDDVDARLAAETPIVLEGYGLTDSNESVADYGRLYIAESPFIRHSLAELLIGRPGSPDTCNGDSGGPAYVVIDGVKTLAGITSRAAISDGTELPCGEGGIYTMISAFEDFVETASGGLYVSGGSDVDLPPPPPPPPGAGSCANSCGESDPGGTCFCNFDCVQFGDCCDDYEAECVDAGEGEGEGEAAEGEGEGEGDRNLDPAGTDDDGGCSSSGPPSLLGGLALLLLRSRRRVCTR